MKAGDLNRRAYVHRRVDTQDATTGEMVAAWSSIGMVWCAIEPLTGREALIDEGIRAEMDTRIRVRYSAATAAIQPTYRLVFHDTTYNVVSVADRKAAHEEIHLMCKSGLNEG